MSFGIFGEIIGMSFDKTFPTDSVPINVFASARVSYAHALNMIDFRKAMI